MATDIPGSLDRILESEHWQKDLSKMAETASSAEFIALLEGFQARGGISGLDDWDQRRMAADLFKSWHEKDPSAARVWLEQVGNDGDFELFVEPLIEAKGKEDLVAAIELAESFGRPIEVDSSFLSEAMKQGVDLFIRALKLRASDEWGGGWGGTLDVPEDFDIAKAMQEMSTMRSELKKQGKHLYFPTNQLLSPWILRDSQAALDWTLKQEGHDFMGEPLQNYLSTYSAHFSSDDVQTLLAELHENDLLQGGRGLGTFGVFAEIEDRSVLRGFLNHQIEPAERYPFIRRMLKESSHGWGNAYTQTRSELIRELKAEERVDFLSTDEGRSLLKNKDHLAELREIYRHLGHTEEEMAPLLRE